MLLVGKEPADAQ